jgi:hypothetical protein
MKSRRRRGIAFPAPRGESPEAKSRLVRTKYRTTQIGARESIWAAAGLADTT